MDIQTSAALRESFSDATKSFRYEPEEGAWLFLRKDTPRHATMQLRGSRIHVSMSTRSYSASTLKCIRIQFEASQEHNFRRFRGAKFARNTRVRKWARDGDKLDQT